MKRYYISVDYDFRNEIVAEEATEGEWVKFEDVKQELIDLREEVLLRDRILKRNSEPF